MSVGLGCKANALNILNTMCANTKSSKRAATMVATGEKFDSAGLDSAAEYNISEKMRFAIRGLNADVENTGNASSVCKIASNGLQNIKNIMENMKAKIINAANGIYTDEERRVIQEEIDQQKKEIDDIAKDSNMNGIRPLDAASGSYKGKMVINGKSPFDGQKFVPVASIDGTEVKLSDGAYGYRNQINMMVNGNLEYIRDSGWTAVRRTDENTWERTLEYNKNGASFSLTEKTVLQSVYNDMGIKHGEAYFTTYELENHGPGVAIDFVKMIDTDLYAGGVSSRDELYTDLSGVPYKKEQIFYKNEGNMPDGFENRPQNAYQYGLAGGVTIHHGTNGPDAVVMSEYGTVSIDDIKNRVQPGNDLTGDLWYQMAWVDKTVAAGGSIRFDVGGYGFHALYKESPAMWVQSGLGANRGFDIRFCNASTSGLGLTEQPNVLTQKNANAAIDTIDRALTRVLRMASAFGASQTRCEKATELSVIYQEQLVNSESTIRDADMGQAIVDKTKFDILVQASQMTLGKQNEMSQRVLELLS